MKPIRVSAIRYQGPAGRGVTHEGARAQGAETAPHPAPLPPGEGVGVSRSARVGENGYFFLEPIAEPVLFNLQVVAGLQVQPEAL